MKSDTTAVTLTSLVLLTLAFVSGFALLAVRLKAEQVDRAADHRSEMASQSFRRVQTAGLRGRIFDRNGVPLADNQLSLCLEMTPETFRSRGRSETTADNIQEALASLSAVIGRPPTVDSRDVARHLKYELARPLVVWRNLTEEELARFSERARAHPGFTCVAEAERTYPQGTLAAHLLGFVGRDRVRAVTGDLRVNYAEKEPFGREGLERQYDDYLRGMPGEDRVIVDARGYATARETLVAPCNGCDLTLTIDVDLQRAAEAQLEGCKGAFVAIDPRDGSVRACASAPTFNPNDCVPVLRKEVYDALAKDEGKPMLSRATAGTYAPGSTFKPVTALAALGVGWSAGTEYECDGAFRMGEMRIRCSGPWGGHGPLNLADALKKSCNPYFCHIGMRAGTNAVCSAARELGLGSRTGIDFPTDACGVVPDGAWKMLRLNERWYPGDLAQMSIGQGQLLVTPMQMARVAAALGTGRIVTPRLNAAVPVVSERLPFPESHLAAVREGMRRVTDDGTGRRAAEGVSARVIGKTGTAEVGRGERRRKNTWFIAYVTPTADSLHQEPLAVAMVIENGDTGGGTTAPKVGEVLKAFYNRCDIIPEQ